jgi:hypothetical protein
MGFTLQLAQDLIEVEAGGNSPVTIVVSNRGDAGDRFELEIEGLDLDWKAIPVPVFSVERGEVHSERAFFKPPRASENGAGNYPFVVRVRSLESGEQKTVQGVLRLKPYHSLTMEISPKKGLFSWSTHRNTFDIDLVNLGNTEHTLQLVGSDPEDACTYEFDQERVTVSPGQQKEVSVEVRPVSSPVFSGSKLVGFSLHARSVDVPSVAASAQAQLERRSLLSPANLTAVIVLLLIVASWYVMKPKPPTIDLQVNPRTGVTGDKVTVSWAATDADRVKITELDANGQTTALGDEKDLSSTVVIPLGPVGTETFYAEVFKGGSQGKAESKTVAVSAPAPQVTPTIVTFTASQKRVKVPGEVIFHWEVKDSVKVALTPDFQNLEPGLDSQSVQFTTAGDKDYVLVAWSKDGVPAYSKPIHITAYQVSEATIVNFSADPKNVLSGGSTTLSWNVINASQVSLSHDGIVDSPLAVADSKAYPITHDTVFVLQALDSKGIKTTARVTVKLQAPPPTPPASGPTDGSAPTTATTGTAPSAPPSTGQTTGANDGGQTSTTGRNK